MSVLTAIIFVILGFALLYYGGDWMVLGSIRLAARVGVAPVVIGLTVVAFGTSLPELLVSMLSALQGLSVVAVGNILGSDIFNLCLIVGVSAILANPLEGSPAVARRDMNILIGGMILFGILGRDLVFDRTDGIILTIVFSIYMFITVRYPASDDTDAEVLEALEEIDGEPEDHPENSAQMAKHLATEPYIKYILLGILTLPIGAELLVRGGVALATMAGISQRFVAMTLVSWGTSLPEMATSLAAAYHGHAGLCIGNVVGSNLFNTVCIMGLTSMTTNVTMLKESFGFDFGLACIATIMLAVLHRGGRNITRAGGCILLAGFVTMFILLSL